MSNFIITTIATVLFFTICWLKQFTPSLFECIIFPVVILLGLNVSDIHDVVVSKLNTEGDNNESN